MYRQRLRHGRLHALVGTVIVPVREVLTSEMKSLTSQWADTIVEAQSTTATTCLADAVPIG